jgi:hypothetical protein
MKVALTRTKVALMRKPGVDEDVDEDEGGVEDEAGGVDDEAGGVEDEAGGVDNEAGVDNKAGGVDNEAGGVVEEGGGSRWCRRGRWRKRRGCGEILLFISQSLSAGY